MMAKAVENGRKSCGDGRVGCSEARGVRQRWNSSWNHRYISLFIMNTGSPIIVRSSRTQLISRSVQTLQVYSCQLFIDSFKISYRGFVYFLWASENSQIQSLKYESSGKLVQVKQTLTIGVRIASKNGKEQPLHTYLKLMNDEGEELDEFQIQINSLTSQFKELEVPMDRGLCILRIRKRQMNINEQLQRSYLGLYRSSNKHDEKQAVGSEYDSLQEELIKIKKQLEDEVYLNNKLKNDRDVLLTKNQELELEIEKVLLQVAKEITLLRAHYENRITIREHSYEEEIQALVCTFNVENQQNRKIVQLVLRQKLRIQEDIKIWNEKNKALQLQLTNRSELLNSCQMKIKELTQNVAQLQSTLTKQQQSHLQQSGQLKKQIQTLTGEIQDKNGTLLEYEQRIAALQAKIEEYEHMLGSKDQEITRMQRQHSEETNRIQQQQKTLVFQVQTLKAKIEEYQSELEFNQNVIGQLKKQYQQKENELYQQIQNIEQLYNKKIQDLMLSFQFERENQYNYAELLLREKAELEQKIRQLTNYASQTELKMDQLKARIELLQNELKYNRDSILAKDQMIVALQKEIQLLKTKQSGTKGADPQLIADYQQRIAKLESELARIKQQLEEKERMLRQVRDEMLYLQKRLKGNEKAQLEQSDNISIEYSSEQNKQQDSQMYHLLSEKQQEITQLRRRIRQLQRMEEELRNQLNSQGGFPEVVVPKISDQESVMDSEEEKYLKRKENSRRSLKQAPISHNLAQESPQTAEPTVRRLSTGNQLIQRMQKISVHHQVVRSQKKIMQPPSPRQPSNHQTNKEKESSMSRMIPRPPSLKIKKIVSTISNKDDHSQMSATSAFKIRQSKKSKQSQEKMTHFQKHEKSQSKTNQMQRHDGSYLRQIQAYQDEIRQLKAELNNHRKSKSYNNNTHNQTMGSFFFRSPVIELKKVSTQSQMFLQDVKIKPVDNHELQHFEAQLQNKDMRISQLQEQIRQLKKIKEENEKQIKELLKIKEEKDKELGILTSKLAQCKKRQEQSDRKMNEMSEIIQKLHKDISQLQEKLKKQKQTSEQLKTTLKQLSLHYQNAQAQIKKLKSQLQSMMEKLRKMETNQLTMTNLKKEIEELQKRVLDLTKINNHVKLQNDSLQEEVRMVKKKHNDQIILTSEWQEKCSSLERAIQQFRRKQGKLKREIQQSQDQARRSKSQYKKLQEEMQSLASAQVGWHLEKRKYLDEIANLHDQLNKKEVQINKLNKDIDRAKLRADQKDDFRTGKKGEFRQELQRLQNELVRKEKRLFEQCEQSKLLRARLELSERENKKMIDKTHQSFGEKLKYYIEQMGNIKKILDQYQADNSRLKMQNNAIYQQFQLLKNNYQKLQNNYNEITAREEDILNELQLYVNEINTLKQRLTAANEENQRTQFSYEKLRNSYFEEKRESKKMVQKLQNNQTNLEKSLVQLKQIQAKYQNSIQQKKQIIEKYKHLEKQKMALDQQYKKVKTDFENALHIYLYKKQDLEKAVNQVNQVRQKQRKLKEQQFQKLSQEYNKTINTKTQRMEQEYLAVCNQNNKLKAEMHLVIEQNGRQKRKIHETEMQCEKMRVLKPENEHIRANLQEIKAELMKRNEKISKMEVNIQAMMNEKSLKQRQLKESEKIIENINQQIKVRKKAQRELQEALARTAQKSEKDKSEAQLRNFQKETQTIKQYETKINGLQAQLQKSKDKQLKNVQQTANKMKKLQTKLDEMQQALKQKQKAIESRYLQEIRDLQNSLMRISQQIQDKVIRNDQLNTALLMLEDQNKILIKQNIELRQNGQQEKKQFQTQLSKLNEKMKLAQSAYSKNVKHLEQELVKMAQSKPNFPNIRSKVNEEERISKRYEQKLKNKDEKINELKQSLNKLQQTLLKFKKKETFYQTNIVELEKTKQLIFQHQKQKKRIKAQFESQLKRNAQLIRELRKQILNSKQDDQKLQSQLQEKRLKYDSVCCELKTTKQLYAELRTQLNKRKNNLAIQIEGEACLQQKLRLQQNKIDEITLKLVEQTKKTNYLESQLKRRVNEHKQSLETISQLKLANSQYKNQIEKLNSQLQISQKTLNDTNTSYQSAKKELKQSKIQIVNLKKNQQELSILCRTQEQLSIQLKREHQQILTRYIECQKVVQKYQLLNQRSKQEIGCDLQGIFQRYSILLSEKDQECNQMIEEIQELKFINERKYIDYDDFKKISFELKLKKEEFQALTQQLQNLRRVCDKLQEEKKNAVFKEEVIRLQLQNLAHSVPSQLRSRIEGILSGHVLPSYTTFSFY